MYISTCEHSFNLSVNETSSPVSAGTNGVSTQ